MKEIVVISGKGGTGKTSIVAAFATLAGTSVLADCDVDAADLHLIMKPNVYRSEKFKGGMKARIRSGHCEACGKCEEVCRFDAIFFDGPGNGKVPRTFRVDELSCEGCGVCAWFCNYDAIDFREVVTGNWFEADSRFGPMVYARLIPGAENSGKLVSLIREKAKAIAEKQGHRLIIVDGSPGIGCQVISSITGADAVVIVTEPTLSGIHDMSRVTELASHFDIKTFGIINKWTINPEMAQRTEAEMKKMNVEFLGRIRYDDIISRAQISEKSVIEMTGTGVAREIKDIWERLTPRIDINL